VMVMRWCLLLWLASVFCCLPSCDPEIRVKSLQSKNQFDRDRVGPPLFVGFSSISTSLVMGFGWPVEGFASLSRGRRGFMNSVGPWLGAVSPYSAVPSDSAEDRRARRTRRETTASIVASRMVMSRHTDQFST
jgi:hypothetical protein